MAADRFFDQPFDEGTLTKLQIFQLYTREWLPVFLAKPDPKWQEVHVFDFFAGPGQDSNGVPGSPLRLLSELRKVQGLPGWSRVQVGAHFFDHDRRKVEALTESARIAAANMPSLQLEVENLKFDAAFPRARRVLARRDAAKLLFIDQFGVDSVSEEVFKELVSFPRCDILFFVSSSTLYRFRDHPAIKQKIRRPNDYYHVHRAVLDYYRTLLPSSSRYFLGGFSIKKGSNVYGLIFGSAHPLGMDKFLRVAWKTDEMNGEADFDINRDDCGPLLAYLLPPTKITAFEVDLATQIRVGAARTEADVVDICFQHGMRRQHAGQVLKALKAMRVIECDFRVPAIERLKAPRPIRVL